MAGSLLGALRFWFVSSHPNRQLRSLLTPPPFKAGLCFVVIVFTVPETYAPKILATKAKKLRKSTGETEYFAPLERQSVKLKDRLEAILLKPFKMLFLEPMLLATTAYMSFVYGILYLLFEGAFLLSSVLSSVILAADRDPPSISLSLSYRLHAWTWIQRGDHRFVLPSPLSRRVAR